MTDRPTSSDTWLHPIKSLVQAAHEKGAFFVAFAVYRPDLVRELASGLKLPVVDFRAAFMQQHGWDAGRIGLDALTSAIEAHTEPDGLVLQNAEALLATKSAAERHDWFTQTIIRPWARPVVIPVAVFQADLPPAPGRFFRVDPRDVAEPSLIYRLATQ